ncbi:MAG: hypothetical protein RLZZ60_557 [Bacteroidota bacterium]|jgi:type I restriction enzyme S subunit
MELKQGFKKTELGIIPEDWEVKEFADVMDGFSSGQTPYRAVAEYYKGDIPWITSGELNYNTITDTIEKITIEGAREANLKKIPKGTFLFAITGLEAAGTRGSCAITGIEATTNQSCMALYPKKGLLITPYLYHYYVRYGNELAFKYCQGTKQQSYTGGIAKKLPILVPPSILEQTAIANALSDMDALISQTEKLIEKKKAIKQGAIQELLKPKEGWVTKKFTDVVNYIHGKAHEQFIVENGKFEVVNSKFISTDGKVKKYSDQSFLTAKKGDVLTVLSDLPNGKALAKCFYVEHDNKYAVNQRICIWRSINNYPKFLFYLLNRHEYFMALNDGVSQTHILNGHIEKFYIRIPENYLEQQSIAETLWDIDQELQLMETKLTKLKQQKQGMMQTLLTGKIRLVS